MMEVNVHERAGKQGRKHWQYDFRVTLPDGSIYRERRKARGATSEAAARRIGEARLREVLRTGPPGKKPAAPEPTSPTVEVFAAEWLDLCRTARQSPITVAHREIMLRLHILPVVGAARLDQITEHSIVTLRKRLADHKASSVNLIVNTFLSMLRRAAKLGYRVTIPQVGPLPEQRERHWYAPEDYERLVASAATFDDRGLAIVLLGGDAGLRAGEMSALRWQDVDFAHSTLYVRRNLVMRQEREPKWGTARDIPMSQRLHDVLARLRAEDGGVGRVLKREGGSPVETAHLRSVIERAARYAGIPLLRTSCSPPQLRHALDAERRGSSRCDGTARSH